MNQMLKQAIVATRAGNTKEAQILLTRVLKENPNEVQAWYLLSLLVDSESKKQAYLQKVLSLDPHHAKAQEQLAQLQAGVFSETHELEPEGFELSPGELDSDLEADEAQLPDWLQNGLAADQEPTEIETAVAQQDDNLPDWLKDNLEPSWVEEQPTLISESREEREVEQTEVKHSPQIGATRSDSPAQTIKRKPSDSSRQDKPEPAQTEPYGTLLYALIIGAIITLLLLVYFIFSAITS